MATGSLPGKIIPSFETVKNPVLLYKKKDWIQESPELSKLVLPKVFKSFVIKEGSIQINRHSIVLKGPTNIEIDTSELVGIDIPWNFIKNNVHITTKTNQYILENYNKQDANEIKDIINKIIQYKPISIHSPSGLPAIVNSLGMEFILIPSGEFLMGASPDDKDATDDEKPAHKVKITKPFYMSKYEVTQKQWIGIMGNNPSHFKDNGKNCPVENVSWNDVQEFIKKLNSLVGNGYDRPLQYRLPTEAEWEYAARAGSTTRYYWGNEIDDDFLWYSKNSEDKKHPVGQKTPNAFGLYDMLGNVWEWTNDWYDNKYYSKSPSNDPTGPESGSRRVLRGGSWDNIAQNCRSSYRSFNTPGFRYSNNGFRVVLLP